MRRVRWATIAALLSCVPASEKAPPAGAIGVVTEPSAAARGDPFTTADGWTVRIEGFALQLLLNASSTTNDATGFGGYGSSEAHRFDASKSTEIFAPGVRAGAATATIKLNGRYVRDGDDGYDDRSVTFGLTPDVDARFLARADVYPGALLHGSYEPSLGPSIRLKVRAERGGRVVAFDLTFYADSGYFGHFGPVGDGGSPPDFGPHGRDSIPNFSREVQGDALVTAPLRIVAEALFVDETTSALAFDDFAKADVDNDGVLTGAEFGGSSGQCSALGAAAPCFSDRIAARAGHLLVVR